jgi:hypothetical protein
MTRLRTTVQRLWDDLRWRDATIGDLRRQIKAVEARAEELGAQLRLAEDRAARLERERDAALAQRAEWLRLDAGD